MFDLLAGDEGVVDGAEVGGLDLERLRGRRILLTQRGEREHSSGNLGARQLARVLLVIAVGELRRHGDVERVVVKLDERRKER